MTKEATGILRPDRSTYNSFPSGHTAIAFASAEFLRMEYKDVSVWYGIAGYTVATAVGGLRVYNNRHWFSDVLTGAGVGILSTQLASSVQPWLSQKLFKHHYYNHQSQKAIVIILYTTYKNCIEICTDKCQSPVHTSCECDT